MKLRELREALKAFRDINEGMTISQALTFVVMAENQGVTVGDLKKIIGFTEGAGTRNAAMMTERAGPNKEGLKLARQDVDPQDIRRKVHTLTPKGEALKALLESI